MKLALIVSIITLSNFCFAQQSSIDSSQAGPILPITFIDIAGPRPVI